jgi:predicted TIM-barrel fold metal-dependent hydrolase
VAVAIRWQSRSGGRNSSDRLSEEFLPPLPSTGQVDFTVAEVGVDRLVWGGHGPSRSYSTELAKVFDADLTQAQREKIFGGNLRRLAEPIFRQKGYKL